MLVARVAGLPLAELLAHMNSLVAWEEDGGGLKRALQRRDEDQPGLRQATARESRYRRLCSRSHGFALVGQRRVVKSVVVEDRCARHLHSREALWAVAAEAKRDCLVACRRLRFLLFYIVRRLAVTHKVNYDGTPRVSGRGVGRRATTARENTAWPCDDGNIG